MSGMLDGMNGLSTKSTLLVNRLRKLLFPPACLFCRQSLDSDDQAEGCCATCFEQIHIWPTATCMHCGKPMPDGMAPGPCGSCLSHPPAQSRTLNLYGYAGPVRNAVLEWKLQGHEAGVRWLLKAAMPRLSREIGRDTLYCPYPCRSRACVKAASIMLPIYAAGWLMNAIVTGSGSCSGAEASSPDSPPSPVQPDVKICGMLSIWLTAKAWIAVITVRSVSWTIL